MPFEHSLLL